MLLIRIIRNTWLWTALGVRFLIELARSALSVAWAIVNPNATLRPAIIAVPLELRTDARIAALANMVTLTPGTTALHVSDDRKILYIHVLVVAVEGPEQASWRARGDLAMAVQPAAAQDSPGVRAVLDLAPLNAQRRADRWLFVAIDILLAAVGALIAFLYVRHVLMPLHDLTERLASDKAPEAPTDGVLQPATTEVGQLQRVLARWLDMERERNAAYQELAERERAESLAAIAASLAHDVRSPTPRPMLRLPPLPKRVRRRSGRISSAC